MSQTEQNDIQVEIQKFLLKINDDMTNLNNELTRINTLVEENASLPETIKMVNEKLIATAKEAGIDLTSIKDIEKNEENDNSDGDLNDDGILLTKNTIAAVTEKLSEKVHQVLNKQ